MPAGRINKLTVAKENALKKCILPYEYAIKEQNNSTAVVIVRAPSAERKDVKTDIEKKLKAKKYKYTSVRAGGSIGATDIEIDEYKVRITYKNLSGGMSETTLNSTITELAPALAFMANKKTFSTVDQFYTFLQQTLKQGNQSGCYLNDRDKQAGHQFIKDMPTSSKFKEKMENAMGVLKYLHKLDSKTKIEQVYFAYRAKPTGINTDHKGDLFVKFTTGKMLGVSLKAGGAKTAEPQLNTYVNKFFDDINRPSDKEKLRNSVYREVHSKVGLPGNWQTPSQKKQAIDKIEEFRIANARQYEILYDKQLELCRDAVIAAINLRKKDADLYIKKKIIKKDENVPLEVVKAYGKNYKMVTDEDAIETHLPACKKITARKSTTSKQEWFIDLVGTKETITMKMSIRTNQPPPNNKIAQGFNLAIKFNGIA